MGIRGGTLRIKTAFAPVAGFFLALFSTSSFGDPEVDYATEFANRVKAARAVAPLGSDLFGDQTSWYAGQTTFRVTDVDVPGNSALPVRVTRTRSTAEQEVLGTGAMGDWDVELPYISAVYRRGFGWADATRCTSPSNPPSMQIGDNTVQNYEYWRGTSITLPGRGTTQMLRRPPAMPGPAGAMFIAPGHTAVVCGAMLKNYPTEEGFIAITPDGTRYIFDWIVYQPFNAFAKPDPDNGLSFGFSRDEVRIYATRVEDRFGNYVDYSYEIVTNQSGAVIGNRPTLIASNDGRRIDLLDHDGNGTIDEARVVDSVTNTTRSWTYGYQGTWLTSVSLPDGSAWSIYTTPTHIHYAPGQTSTGCSLPLNYDLYTTNETWKFTHPSGAKAEFVISPKRHVRSNTPRCRIDLEREFNRAVIEPAPAGAFDAYGLISKKLIGLDGTTETWTATYVAGTQPGTKLVTLTNPDSTAVRYTFGTSFYETEGKVLRTEALSSTGAVVRDVQTTQVAKYRLGSTGLHYESGMTPQECQDLEEQTRGTEEYFDCIWIEDSFGDVMQMVTPANSITQDGVTFSTTTALADFDIFGRATRVTRSSGLGFSKTEQIAYHDNTALWVLGQVASVTVSGKVPTQTTYDPATALPVARYAFGKLMRESSWNADGTLASVTDGSGFGALPSHAIQLSNWKRGLPRTITFPVTPECVGSCTQTAVVDDFGWIRSVTDEGLNTTGYDYDAMGRITRIDYPAGGWLSTYITYVRLPASELGFPAGSWRREETTGTNRERTYYDARLRPKLTARADTNPLTAETIYQSFGYDFEGRETFASYPSSTFGATAGINTTYDTVGRVTQRKTTDPVTLETTTYPAGQKRVTDANGNVTTFSFQMFDEPSYEVTTLIQAPEGQTTTIGRDEFGNMTSAVQSGLYAGATVTATRTYVYDQHMRLCKRIEPETNQRVVAYDDAGNVAWSADGQSITGCEYDSVAAADRTAFTYDTRNRVTLVDAPGTDSDVVTTYWPTGDVATLTNAAGSWAYIYNNRRMLETETLTADAMSFALGYRYNPQGVMDEITYPSGREVALNPDAFGRSRAVGGFATGITYHASGALSGFTHGNGLAYGMTLDARLRPERLKVTGGGEERVNLLHGYDAASNITSIIDTGDVTEGMDTRQMTYDGLHRLTKVSIEGIFAQDFTNAGAQSTSIPQGVTNVTMTLHGSGGNGGKHANGGGGGGGGALCQKSIAIDDQEWGGTVNFTVGASGTASTLTRTFMAGSVNLSAGGGAAGSGATGGAGGVGGTGCATKISGSSGMPGEFGVGGSGGSSPQGGSGGGGADGDGQTGGPGGQPGGGGGGGGPRNLEEGLAAGNGGTGGKGRVRLEWNIGTVTYQYDPLNNLRTRGGPSPLTYSANATTNRLDSVTGGLTRTYTYNAKGQVEHDGTRDFVWSGADRIVEVVGIASYAYDGLGKRIKTTKASGAVEYTIYSRVGTLLYSYKPALSESTDYVYLGSMALAELRMAPGVLSNTDSRNPAQTVQVTLAPGRSPQVGGAVSAQVETTYLHTNLLGSPIQWSSRAATGVWLNSEHYEAYGHKLNGVGDKLGYTGHAHDFETDLTYMQARFYDPQVGRFLSADPVEFEGGDPFNVNRYAYANNNPYAYTDPSGMSSIGDHFFTGSNVSGVAGGNTAEANTGWIVEGASAGGGDEGSRNGNVQVAQIGPPDPLGSLPQSGDPNGQPIVPDALLNPPAKEMLAGRRTLTPDGQVIFRLPGDWEQVPLPSGGGFVLGPPGWTPADGLKGVVRVQPAGTGSSSQNPGGYYVIYSRTGQRISPYSGRTVGDDAAHNPLGVLVPPPR
jgi:RHS repeat-associated protein